MMNQPPVGPNGHRESSPRKKKGQISFAQNSFLSSFDLGGSLEEANNKKVAEDVQFLYSQLQRAKKEREAVLERCDTLETQLQTVHRHFKEASTRRQMEEDAFRSQLSSAKAQFDRKLVKLTIKAKDREDVLIDWVHTITDLRLDEENEAVSELLTRTLALLPPSLRELMSRGKGDVRAGVRTTSRSKKSKARRTPSATSQNKHKPPTTTYTHSAASTDPDALLAIISENMNVLDNFNLNFNNTSSKKASPHAHPTYSNEEVSDSDHLRGNYDEYLTSENEEVERSSATRTVYMTHNSPSKHYSGLASHPKATTSGTSGNGTSTEERTNKSNTNKGAHKRRVGSPSKNNKRRGTKGSDRDDDNDSVDSGTVTGSIMDFNEATSDEDPHERTGFRGAYATGLPRLDSDPHNLRSADTHYPTTTTHAHSVHPSHPLQLQDSYGTAVRSATQLLHTDTDTAGDVDYALLSEDNAAQDDKFIETMRNLQELVVHSSKPNSSSEKRRMSESAVNYTNMVRGLLDSMSELSKSVAQDNDLSVSGIGAEIEHMDGMTGSVEGIEGMEGLQWIQGIIDSVNANTLINRGTSTKSTTHNANNTSTNSINNAYNSNSTKNNTSSTSNKHSSNSNTSNIMIDGVKHTISSGAEGEVGSGSGILGARRIGSNEDYAPTASSFDLLLAEAGVTLDALSHNSADQPHSSHTDYTYGTVGAYEDTYTGSIGSVGGGSVGGNSDGGNMGGVGGKSDYSDAFEAEKSLKSDLSGAVDTVTSSSGAVYNDVDIVRLIHTAQGGTGEKKKKHKSKRNSTSEDILHDNNNATNNTTTNTNNTSTTNTASTNKKKKKQHNDTEHDRVAELVGSINLSNNNHSHSGSGDVSLTRLSVGSSKLTAAGARAMGVTNSTTSAKNTTKTTHSTHSKNSKHNASEYSFNFESEYHSTASQQSGAVSTSSRRVEEDSVLKLGGELDSPSESTVHSQRKKR